MDEYTNTPGYASVKTKLAANKAKFEVLSNAELGVEGVGLAGSFAEVLEVAEPPRRTAGTIITGDSPAAIAEQLVAALAGASIL